MMKTVVGIIGAGRIGQLHAINIQQHLPQFQLKLIHDPYIDREWANSKGFSIAESVDDIFKFIL